MNQMYLKKNKIPETEFYLSFFLYSLEILRPMKSIEKKRVIRPEKEKNLLDKKRIIPNLSSHLQNSKIRYLYIEYLCFNNT